MVDWLSLTVPLAYLGILLGSLATFSSLHRKRKARKSSSLEPWFPPHLQRDIYLSLLHLDPPASSSATKGKKNPSIPDTVLKAALLRRAAEDIRRLLTLRTQKPALAMLLQRGSVGDDLWQRLLRAEKEMEEEVRDVVAEANAYQPNWGQTIFQSANEMMNNAMFRGHLNAEQAKLSEEKEWWNKKKASIKEGFMKELDQEDRSAAAASDKCEPAASTSTPPNPALSSTTTTTTTEISMKTFEEAQDNAVDNAASVEDNASSPAAMASTSGGKKKKKGKK